MYIIDLERVLYFKAEDHYTYVYYDTGAHFMVPFGLSKVEAAVAEFLSGTNRIVRLGRSYMINLDHVFHINVTRQTLTIIDSKGGNHCLQLPKHLLRNLIEYLSGQDPEVLNSAEREFTK